MANSRHAQDLQWQSLWECEGTELGINGLHQPGVFVTLCVTRHDVMRSSDLCKESGPGARDGRDQLTRLVTWWGETQQNGSNFKPLIDGWGQALPSLNPRLAASNWSERRI